MASALLVVKDKQGCGKRQLWGGMLGDMRTYAVEQCKGREETESQQEKSKGVEKQAETTEAAAGLRRRTGFSAPFRSCHARCTDVAVDGGLSGEGPLEKRGVSVLQGRKLPKLH